MRQIEALLHYSDIKNWALETIDTEVSAVSRMRELIDENLFEVVKTILEGDGRVVITGIGKSAAIANKIVATLNSTGTPSIFMHAADAVHGDLGIIQTNDVVICLSKSGNTPEIKVLVPLLRSSGNCLVAMVGDKSSFLGQHADYILDVSVDKEACPHNLAPTTSTTMQLVMGDVLAICLLNARGFTSSDFARFHPGGSLGKRLYLRLNDMVDRSNPPKVDVNERVPKVIMEITAKRLGATAVMENGKLVGVITDGDIRRMLEKSNDISSLKASDIMGKDPVTMESDAMARDAAKLLTEKKISQMIVVEDGTYIGMCHIHEFHKEGIL